MTTWVSIQYRDFWDIPRIFWLTYQGRTFLFDCPFDEQVEDYPDYYRIYEMPPLAAQDLKGSWVNLHTRAIADFGTVRLKAVRFDETKRREIDAEVLEAILARMQAARADTDAPSPADSPIPS